MMCEACERGDHEQCGMQTWCECDCGGPDDLYLPDPMETIMPGEISRSYEGPAGPEWDKARAAMGDLVSGSKLDSVARMWASFSEVIPPDAPDVQRVEMRRAFYAGVWGLMCEVKRVGTDEVSEDAGVAYFESIVAECQAFRAELLAGRA